MNKRIRKKIITRIFNKKLYRTGLTRLEKTVFNRFNKRCMTIAMPIINEIIAEEEYYKMKHKRDTNDN